MKLRTRFHWIDAKRWNIKLGCWLKASYTRKGGPESQALKRCAVSDKVFFRDDVLISIVEELP